MSNNRIEPVVFKGTRIEGVDHSYTPRFIHAVTWAAVLVWGGGMLGALTLDDPRLRFPSFLVYVGLAGVAWLGLVFLEPRWRQADASRWGWALVALGVAARLLALERTPAFSEDVFRYIYEGRAVWWYGWTFPFAAPPAAGPSMGVDAVLLDEAWLRINHPELSTIYPPLAQLVFVIAGAIGEISGEHLVALKILLVAADLGTWAILARSRGTWALGWGLSPLVVLEVAREGHADSLSALGLAIGIAGFSAARPRVGYLGWATAALAKLNGLVAMAAAVRTTRRGLLLAAALSSLVALPYLFAGGTAGEGLSAYASRWRSGDGAFSVLLAATRPLLGGEYHHVDALGITVTRHQLARLLTVGAFGLWTLATLARPAPVSAVPARAGLLLLGLLLLAPTLHPWYVLWLLPFAAGGFAFAGQRAIFTLALLAPVLHHPGWLELLDGQWRELAAVRAAVHLPVWLWLIADLARARARS